MTEIEELKHRLKDLIKDDYVITEEESCQYIAIKNRLVENWTVKGLPQEDTLLLFVITLIKDLESGGAGLTFSFVINNKIGYLDKNCIRVCFEDDMGERMVFDNVLRSETQKRGDWFSNDYTFKFDRDRKLDDFLINRAETITVYLDSVKVTGDISVQTTDFVGMYLLADQPLSDKIVATYAELIANQKLLEICPIDDFEQKEPEEKRNILALEIEDEEF